jgi:hypothetical protein
MAEFKEIIFTLNDLRKGDFNNDNWRNGQSIFQKAQHAILNFPVLVSDLLSLEDLTMITKALEREYATVTRLAMGLDDTIDYDRDRGYITNKVDYINKFHTNDYTSSPKGTRELFEATNQEYLTVSNESYIPEHDTNALVYEALGLNMDNLNDMTLSEDKMKVRYNSNGEVQYERTYETFKSHDYKGQLLDNDVKKANELLPTTIDVVIYQKIGGAICDEHLLLGIKAVAHKVRSKDMIESILNTIEQKKNFFRFIQWTTGEIKFFKDYLLCLDMLKKEALESRSKDSSMQWFRSLKHKSTMSRIRRNLNLREQLIPNSTIVMSMDEVDYLRQMYNIDLLKNTKLVEKLMETYFLIGFVICDPAAEIVHFKFDAFKDYQTHSYKSLERENRNQGNDLKALVSLMGTRF